MLRITHFTTAHKTDTRIRISKLEEDQFGYYICQASNKLGTAVAIMRLESKCYFVL